MRVRARAPPAPPRAPRAVGRLPSRGPVVSVFVGAEHCTSWFVRSRVLNVAMWDVLHIGEALQCVRAEAPYIYMARRRPREALQGQGCVRARYDNDRGLNA